MKLSWHAMVLRLRSPAAATGLVPAGHAGGAQLGHHNLMMVGELEAPFLLVAAYGFSCPVPPAGLSQIDISSTRGA